MVTTFEEDIVTRLKRFGRSEPRTSAWILGHLGQVSEDYPWSMHQQYLEFLPSIQRWARAPSYAAFWRVLRELRKEGRIEISRYEPSRKHGIARSYYKLADKAL